MVRALITGAGSPIPNTGCAREFSKPVSVHPAANQYTWVYSEVGKVKAVKRRSGAHLSYTVAGASWLFCKQFPDCN